MGCCNLTLKDIFGYIVVQAGSVLFLVSFFTPYWLLPTAATVDYGIIVKSEKGVSAEVTVYNASEWTEDGVRATYITTVAILALSSVLLTIGSVLQLVTCIVCCCRVRIKAAAALHLISGILILIGNAVFTAMIILVVDYEDGEPELSNFGWSYYMNWGSGAVVVIGSLIEKKARKESENEELQGPMHPMNSVSPNDQRYTY